MWLYYLLFFFGSAFAQTPPPPDLSGSDLINWLYQNWYVGKHTQLSYSEARMYLYNYIDNINDTITDVYGGYKKYLPYGGTETNPTPINCEHTIPQSFFGSEYPMMSDLHHLFPAYDDWNSTRSNYPFAEIPDQETTKWMYLDQWQSTIPTSHIDEYSEYASGRFEPREDHKGNVARAVFYFYTMYPTQAGPLEKVGDLQTFLLWHTLDPVDSLERERNNKIELYQGNRNPYIDYPEIAGRAFGTDTATILPSAPADLFLTAQPQSIRIQWQGSNDAMAYRIYRATDGNTFTVYHTLQATDNSFNDFSVQPAATYYYYLTALSSSGESAPSDTVAGVPGLTICPDLFFTEYVEGSTYNKALEIGNFTGQSVNLADYAIKTYFNGATTAGGILTLNGVLHHGKVIVLVYGQAGETLKSKADLISSSQTLNFNGDDAIGLYKNDTLIDLIGTIGVATSYGKDVTLRRIASESGPSRMYQPTRWDSYPADTFDDLGSHHPDFLDQYILAVGPGNPYQPDQFTLITNYPNPFNPSTTIEYKLPPGSTGVLRIFNLAGQLIREFPLSSDQGKIRWEGRDNYGKPVPGGIYFYQLSGEDILITRKMVLIK